MVASCFSPVLLHPAHKWAGITYGTRTPKTRTGTDLFWVRKFRLQSSQMAFLAPPQISVAANKWSGLLSTETYIKSLTLRSDSGLEFLSSLGFRLERSLQVRCLVSPRQVKPNPAILGKERPCVLVLINHLRKITTKEFPLCSWRKSIAHTNDSPTWIIWLPTFVNKV